MEANMQEKISALVDGELTGECIDVALDMLKHPDQFARLDAYHQIRHALRAGDTSAVFRPDFAASLKTTLRGL
jgi:negative regulator of sigma E activity